jgi:Zn-finger nucleic acid-binding protein
MKCPRCTETALVISDRQGVEIDHCPQCRGVWLDRGELDKLIERSATMEPATAGEETGRWQTGPADTDQGRSPRGRRKDSWLSHIFD